MGDTLNTQADYKSLTGVYQSRHLFLYIDMFSCISVIPWQNMVQQPTYIAKNTDLA